MAPGARESLDPHQPSDGSGATQGTYPASGLAGPANFTVAFAASGALTTTATTIAGPPPGPSRTCELIAPEGVAKLVAF